MNGQFKKDERILGKSREKKKTATILFGRLNRQVNEKPRSTIIITKTKGI